MRTLTPILSLLIAVFLYTLFTQPMYDQVVALEQEVAEYKRATEQYQVFSAELQEKISIKENRSAYDSERLDMLVPEEVNDVRLLVDLEAMAESQNLLFGNIAIDSGDTELSGQSSNEAKVQAQDELRTTDITFEVVGTYEQFKNLLRNIENSLQLLEVTNVGFAVTEGLFQQFTITVRAYAFPKQ